MDVDESPLSPGKSSSPDLFASFSEDENNTQGEKEVEKGMTMEYDDELQSHFEWKGTPLEDLQQSFGRWGPSPLPHISVSAHHTILFKLPVKLAQVPESHVACPQDKWDQDHVRMPNSSESLYPVQETEDEKGLRLRWELVQEALLCSILNSHQLEAAILSYNSRYNEKWNFVALHSFLNHVLNEDETDYFFKEILPPMVRLALQLPELVTAPIPLLKKHKNHAISMSQLQVASLLANAFFCTFPRRNSTKKGSEYSAYPDINFNRLFQCNDGDEEHSITMEKMKCIFSYFKRVCSSAPQGVLTFSRRYMQPASLPDWGKSKNFLPKLYISSKGYIEDEGSGMLQVDFANKYVGGGVLGMGCVQEEIRFLICPELLVTRLFTECLDPSEVLLIVGCERFSNYSGYGYSFKWTGEHHDETVMDPSGRRHCSIVAMDALHFGNPSNQYSIPNLTREINKAYVGFYEPGNPRTEPLSAVATGNWGCGAFRGDAHLKALLQLMAAAEAGRPVAYFTFGDQSLRDRIFRMYRYLVENKVSVGRLWNLLCQYSRLSPSGNSARPDLYKFLYSAVLEPGLPKETVPQLLSSETAIQSSFTGFVSKKPFKACMKETSKTNASEMKSTEDISNYGISTEDIDSLIEEFDSEPDDFQKKCAPQERKQIKKSAQEETPIKKSEQENLGNKSSDSKGKLPAPRSASKSMSCLSLIEESLGSHPSRKERSHDRGQLIDNTHPHLSSSSNNEQSGQRKEGKHPTLKSATKSSSCLDLLEETLHPAKTEEIPEKIKIDTSQEGISSTTVNNSDKEGIVTSSYFQCVEPSSRQPTEDLNSACDNSPIKASSKDHCVISIGSTSPKKVDTPVRSGGTKRKISDYFCPTGN